MEETEYTCPMHPKVLQPKPGSCPFCGMALEPKTITAHSQEDAELKKMTYRFWIGLVCTLPIFFLMFVSIPFSMEIQAALATIVVLFCGWPFFIRGFHSILHLKLNMFTLISIGVGCAYLYSLLATFWPSLFSHLSQQNLPIYFEAASTITILVLLGQILEHRARNKTNHAIRELLNLAPKTARIILSNKTEKDIPLEEVKKGDHLRVRPGEKIPTDGIVIEGEGLVNESMITGEPFSVKKGQNAKVTGGTLNEKNGFVMRVEKIGSETLLSRIIHLVNEAQRSHAPIQRLADQVSAYFVPIVVIVAIITLFAWIIFGPSFSQAVMSAVSVLIIACPCALGLATPMSIMVGVGFGAKNGILIKSAEALEKFSKITTVIVDKTGTLTEGRPKLTKIIPLADKKEDEILKIAASLERGSEHPIAKPIVEKANESNLQTLPLKNFQSISGKGIVGEVDGQKVAIGNIKLFEDLKIDSNRIHQEGIYMAINNKVVAILLVNDAIKESTKEAIEMLHKDNVRIIMVTGDNQEAAERVGKELNIDEIHSSILPQHKHKILQDLQKSGEMIAMAGDGINDAAALAQANIGIAMGTGSDIAIESAGITLVKGDLRGIAKAKKLSHLVMRNIKQNLYFAFLYNILGVPIAAGALYPIFGILLNPIIASIAMTLSSLSVIINSLRLKKQTL